MPDTPTLANLLTQWSSGGPPARRAVYAHLRENPTEAAAVEAFFRDDLRSPLPWKRVIAAEAVLDVYGDEPAAAAALGWALAQGEPAANALGLLEKLTPEHAAPLLADFALREPSAFAAQPPAFQRWAGAVLARAPERWAAVFDHAGVAAESPLLMGLADTASGAQCEFESLVPWLKSRLFSERAGYVAGAALWRITWRVNRDWLASINPHSPRFENDSELLVLLTEVVSEHLGRRPDLAQLGRELLVRLATDAPEKFALAVKRFARIGARGWAVLLPLLGEPAAPSDARALVFEEAARRTAVAPLALHYAHRVIRERADGPVQQNLLRAAGEVLAALGASAGTALPDLLDLIADRPGAAAPLTLAVLAVAPGHPSPRAAVARTLNRLRGSVVFDPDAFAALARVLAWINPDHAPALVEDTGLGLATVETLLRQPAWAEAPEEVRVRHARALAGFVAAPRAEVRARALACLSHYADQLPKVWPALVAALVSRDDATARLAFPLFAALKPAAALVERELRELLCEPNPGYAARAAVALWHLGLAPAEASDRCRAVFTDTTGAWNWTVPREAVAAVVESQRPASGFGADSELVIARARDLLFAEDEPDEAVISARVHSNWPPRVEWDALHGCVSTDPEAPALVLALMCALGASGFAHKIWLIKAQRLLTGNGLVDAKNIVERAINQLGPSAPPNERRTCVRDFFGSGATIPMLMTDMLNHRVSWYRWAALELLDAWGDAEQVAALIGERRWDRSELVRRRALRMVNR